MNWKQYSVIGLLCIFILCMVYTAGPKIASVDWVATIEHVYRSGIQITFWLSLSVWLFVVVSLVWMSMKFNYHLYVKYGRIAMFHGDDLSNAEHAIRIDAAKLAGLKTSYKHHPWMTTLGSCAIVTMILFITILIWPLALLITMPWIVMGVIAWRKRRKASFINKLKGEESV